MSLIGEICVHSGRDGVYRGGQAVHLTRAQFELFVCLWRKPRQPKELVRVNRIIYGGRLDCDQPKDARDIALSQFCKMRERLAVIGVTIVHVPVGKYRVALLDEQRLELAA